MHLTTGTKSHETSSRDIFCPEIGNGSSGLNNVNPGIHGLELPAKKYNYILMFLPCGNITGVKRKTLSRFKDQLLFLLLPGDSRSLTNGAPKTA